MAKKVTIDKKDGTAYFESKHSWTSVLYFFRSEFADGYILAFYSHSPWGRVHDMEQGWVVIDPKSKQVVDECATRSMGMASGEYREWIKDIRKQHGKTKKVFRNESGGMLWKIEE